MSDDRRRIGRDGAEVGDVAVHGELDLAAATLERLPHLELGGERHRQPGRRARCARASVQHHDGTVATGVHAHFDGLHQWQSPRSTGPTLATVEAETRYTKSGDAYIAYQVLGDGGPDLLYLSSGTISIGSIDDEPGFARFHGDLASFARLIRMDLRGVGLSDPIARSPPPSVEQWVGAARAVLDAAGWERAALCGADEGALVAMLTAATHPDRTAALILLNAYARLLRDVDYPQGLPDHLVARFSNLVFDKDRPETSFADLEVFVPAVADDPRFRKWWQ